MQNIGQLIKQISNNLINDMNKKLKKYEITFSQLQVLLTVKECDGTIFEKDISNILKIKHTSLIDILKVLERKELIIKKQSEENSKYTEISLTDKGNELLENMDLGKDKTEKMIAETLGFSSVDEMLKKFAVVLEKLENTNY